MNVFVVYLLMQELFVDEIHSFKFPYMNEKQWLDQLKIIANFHGTSSSQSFHPYKEVEIPTWKGKYPMLRTYKKLQILIKPIKNSYSIASAVFRKFSCGNYRSGLDRGNQSWDTPFTWKNTSYVSLIPFVGNPHFGILVHRVRYLKNLFVCQRYQVTIFPNKFTFWN